MKNLLITVVILGTIPVYAADIFRSETKDTKTICLPVAEYFMAGQEHATSNPWNPDDHNILVQFDYLAYTAIIKNDSQVEMAAFKSGHLCVTYQKGNMKQIKIEQDLTPPSRTEACGTKALYPNRAWYQDEDHDPCRI